MSCRSRAVAPLALLAALVVSACAGDHDPLSVAEADNVPSSLSAADFARLAGGSTKAAGTQPQLASLPKALDTLVVGDSVRYIPTGSMITSSIRQYWYSSLPSIVSVRQDGWVKALAVGAASVVMVPQKQPFPTAFTNVVVVARPAGAPPELQPVVPAPPPVAPAPPPAAGTGVAPMMPQALVDVSMPTATGRTIAVPSGGDLQAALDAAQSGDVVVLAPGSTFVGNFVLRPRSAAGGWVVVRSGGVLPPAGTRVGPSDAPQLARIVSPNANAAISTDAGASGWRLIGLEVTTGASVANSNGLVMLGDGSGAQNSLAQVPSRLVLDRMYVHGTPTLEERRCISLNSASSAVIDSYVADCHHHSFDAQAVWGWNGPGPFLIENNYLEASHEVVGFGGSDPAIANLVPSDIVIRRNHVTRPMSWKGVWPTKNLVEFKAGQRILIEGNVFENNWVDAQPGFAFVWWSSNQDGNAPWTVTQDITFRYNRIHNVAGVFNLTAKGPTASPLMQRILIAHNVVTQLGGSALGGNGRVFQVQGPVHGLTLLRNTAIGPSNDVLFASVDSWAADEPLASFVMRDNVTGGEYTLLSGKYGQGNATLAGLGIPQTNVTGNVFVGRNSSVVPPNNAFASSIEAVGFVNLAGNDLRLALGSPFSASSSTGSTPGADWSLVQAATQNVVRAP